MTATFKLKICAVLLLAIGAFSFGNAHNWHIENPAHGLTDTLRAAEQAAGVR